jgi:quercetin dioxygenase-like cupin family protein
MSTGDTREVIRIGRIEVRCAADGESTGGATAVYDIGVAADARVPAAHRHLGYDETIYGIAGECIFVLEGAEHVIRDGCSLFIPRGARHQFVNRSGQDTRFLAIITPGILSPAYFRELGAIVNAGGPPDPVRIAEVMRRHGLEPC